MEVSSVIALDNIDLLIKEEEIVTLMGPSGSGKTTLLSIIGALDVPTEGEIRVNGITISNFTETEATRFRRDYVGFVFQLHNLIPYLSAAENVELPLIAKKIPKKERIDRVNDLLEQVGLKNRSNHLPGKMSGGEQQRVAICRALANNPKIVLADEPTGNLDSTTGREVIQLMVDMTKKNKGTLLIATHDRMIEEMCTRSINLRDGKVIMNGAYNK